MAARFARKSAWSADATARRQSAGVVVRAYTALLRALYYPRVPMVLELLRSPAVETMLADMSPTRLSMTAQQIFF